MAPLCHRRPRHLLRKSPVLKAKYTRLSRLWRTRLLGLLTIAVGVLAWYYRDEIDLEKMGERLPAWRNLAPEGTTECTGTPILVLPYLLILLYGFLGIAIVCDEYFETSLEVISERLSLSDDVAGATFMAAGSSAPELFTSMLDAFGPSNSIGVGTIVGSAMFNILIIVALSAAVTKGSVHLDWRPVARDVFFYALSIGILVVFSAGGTTYCEYESGETEIYVTLADFQSNYVNGTNGTEAISDACHFGAVGWPEGLIMVSTYLLYILFMRFNQRILSLCERNVDTKVHDVKVLSKDKDDASDENKNEESKESEDGEDEGFCSIPESFGDKILWLLSFPYKILFYITIPDCGKEHLEKFYLLSFVMCMGWLAGLCWLMVHFASEIGCLLSIHPVVMGVTFLAAGTSIPDAMASMIVAREGKADMAIANAVGSNVFDVLLGLGIPWFLVELTLQKRTYVDRDGVMIYVLILAGTLVFYVASIAINRWKMNRRLSYGYLLLYLGYIVFIVARET